MLKKSKSIYIIIILVVLTGALFLITAYRRSLNSVRTFSQDGYILSKSEDSFSTEEAAGTAVVAEPIWFTVGSSWNQESEGISFDDAQGNMVQAEKDIILHYSSGAMSVLTTSAVMNMDVYATGVISQFTLNSGGQLLNIGGSYTIEGDSQGLSFVNLLLKTSETKYMALSPTMTLEIPNRPALSFGEGFLEFSYPAADRNVVLLQDDKNEYTFLTKDAVLVLANGVRIHLDNGNIEPSAAKSGITDTGTFLSFDDIDLTLLDEASSQLPGDRFSTFRFKIFDGLDGDEGEVGTDGEDGEIGLDGEEGLPGAEGVSGEAGKRGATGSEGASNVGMAAPGYDGDTVSGVNILTKLPAVRVLDWQVSGAGFRTTLNTDESAYDIINPQTTIAELYDLTTGERVYWWDGGQSDVLPGDTTYGEGQFIDFSEEYEDGFTLQCNVLEAGHQYRFSITASYTLDEVSGTQEIFTRNFTADDYGIQITQTAVSSENATFSIEQVNDADSSTGYILTDVYYSLDGGSLYSMVSGNYDNILIQPDNVTSATTYDVLFKCILKKYTFSEDGEQDASTMQTEEVLYEQSFTTLKAMPEIGGVKLTAYGSGYFMAELLGNYNAGVHAYEEVVDKDGTISEILFKLYRKEFDIEQDTGKEINVEYIFLTSQRVTQNYNTFFKISDNMNDLIHLNETYYLLAEYTLNDGTKIMTHPVLESNPDKAGIMGNAAWDSASLKKMSGLSMSFVGDTDVWNLAAEAENSVNHELAGITHNQITGMLKADLSKGSFYISNEYPVEVQVSAIPEYYQSMTYGGILESITQADGTTEYKLKGQDDQTGDPQAIQGMVYVPIDLTGLKAETDYMITMYGYERRGTEGQYAYSRVVMGAMSLSTREFKDETTKEGYLNLSLVRDDNLMGIGFYPVLGEPTDDNLFVSGGFTQDFAKKTDAVYRGVATIQFELYRISGNPDIPDDWIGSCEIIDKNADADNSEIYKKFFGKAAELTYNSDEYKKRVVGVGEEYLYPFRDDKGNIILAGSLTNGDYQVRVTAVYDYTDTRYDLSAGEVTPTYGYYTYRRDYEEYVNQLLTEEIETQTVKITQIPYIEPGKALWYPELDNAYIQTEQLTNQELSDLVMVREVTGALYDPNLKSDTVVGVKLNCKYKNDSEMHTQTLIYYGYTEESYNDLNNTDHPTNEDKGKFKNGFTCSVYMAQSLAVPEVWIVSANETLTTRVNTYSQNSGIALEGVRDIYMSRESDYVYGTQTTTNEQGNPVIIYYVKDTVFDRGQSYYFAYETVLKGYEPYEGYQEEYFYFPEQYYELKNNEYTKQRLLKSNEVMMKRQVPEAYAVLESTVQTMNAEGTDTSAQDTWILHVEDPDEAIAWQSILAAGDENAKVHAIDGRGGLQDLQGLPISTDTNPGFQVDFYNSEQSEDSFATLTPQTKWGEDGISNAVLNILKTQMVEKSGQEILPAKATVSNLKHDGVHYKLVADYCLLDRPSSSKTPVEWKSVNLFAHNYAGYHTEADYTDETDGLEFYIAGANQDNNRVSIYIELPRNSEGERVPIQDIRYTGADYLSKVRNITAIELYAFNNAPGKKNAIYERDENGKLLDGNGNRELVRKVLWLYPEAPSSTGSSDYRYYIQFRLDQLDQEVKKEGAAKLQYEPGDILTFSVVVHFATGETAVINPDVYQEKDAAGTIVSDTAPNYALKYVDGFSSSPSLYGSGTGVVHPKFVYTSANHTFAPVNAGRSMYLVKGSRVGNTKNLPWQQNLTLTSEIFDSVACQDMQKSAFLSSSTGYANGEQVLEVLKTAATPSEAAHRIRVVYDKDVSGLEVGSAVPTFSNIQTNVGLSSINITATVNNHNLVSYPQNEAFSIYFLIYKLKNGSSTAMENREFYGLIKNDSAKTGILDLKLELEVNSQYIVVGYYKNGNVAKEEGFKESDLIDSELFKAENFPEMNKLYRIGDTGTAGNVQLAYSLIADENTDTHHPIFQRVINEDDGLGMIQFTTSQGIEIQQVNLELNVTEDYNNKSLRIYENVKSTIMEDEQDTVRLFYFLERCPMSELDPTEDKWETVLADWDSKDIIVTTTDANGNTVSSAAVTKWAGGTQPPEGSPYYWDYYTTTVTTWPEKPTKDANYRSMPYYAGGQIRPGYRYRARVMACQNNGEGNWINVSVKDGKSVKGFYSMVEYWAIPRSDDPYAYITTQAPMRTQNSISMQALVMDTNHTSLEGEFYVRIARQTDTGGWEILQDPKHYNGEPDKAYQMGRSWQLNFSELTSNETYRILFFALMDPEFDNELNFTPNSSSLDTLQLMSANGAENKDNRLMIMPDDYYTDPESYNDPAVPGIRSNAYALKEQFMKEQNSSLDQYSFSPVELTSDPVTKGSLLIGCGNSITTLAEGTDAYAGEITELKVLNQTTLQVKFTGAFNADNIHKIIYDIQLSGADSKPWEPYELEKINGAPISFFDAEGKPNQGAEGTLTIKLDIGAAGMDISKAGRYTLQMNFYAADSDIPLHQESFGFMRN